MDVAANRMELLRIKSKKKLAQTGYKLLKKKRDALIKYFFEYVKEYKEKNSAIASKLHTSYNTLAVAEAISGVNRVKSLAYSTNESFEIKQEQKNLMGVRITQLDIKKVPVEHNASIIGLSHQVIKAQEAFQEVVPELIKLGELKQTIYALADEIRKTKRRVNALEHIHIPKLIEIEKHVKDRLAEMEREEFTRLKHVKANL